MKIFKRLLALSILLLSANVGAYAVNYVSAHNGDWNTNTTWTPNGIPLGSDNVTINAGHTISITGAGDKCANLTLNGTLQWSVVNTVTIFGNYVISATGIESGTGTVQFNAPGTLVTCTGVTSTHVYYAFYSSRTITAGSTVNKTLTTTKIMNNYTLTNQGTFLSGVMDARPGSAFINSTNGSLIIKYAGFMSGQTFTANAVPNTVTSNYTAAALPTPVSGYYNLVIGSTTAGVTTLPSNTTIANNLSINASNTLNSNGFDIIIGGNWSNNGGFNAGAKTVSFNGAGSQTIGGSATTTFFKLAEVGSGTTTLARNTIVTNLVSVSSGVLSTSTFGLTGAAGLTQTGGEFQLGKTGATPLPELSGTYTLLAGKIVYNGAGSQIIKSGITYLDIDIAGSGTKSLSAALNMSGTLSIFSTLDVTASNFAINLQGNWINNGAFVERTGTVTLNGTVSQTLNGTSDTEFENLTLNNSAGALISGGNYLLDGALTLSNGTFNTGGNSFTMSSTASKTARIAPITGSGAISGNFTIERFLSTRDTTWADLSSPVQDAVFSDWENELIFISYAYAPPNQYPTQYTYGEAIDDFNPLTDPNTALTPGLGVEVFLTGDFSYSNLPPTTISVKGVPNQGNQNLNALVSFSGGGSNLVGNPFASSISWTSVFSASSGIMNTYDTYDYLTGNYSTHGLGTEIGSGQGFWVYSTSGSPTLQVNESAKTTSSNSSIRSAVAEPYFTLKLSNNDPHNKYSHVLKVAADNASSDGWDDSDHPFRKSPNKFAPYMYTSVDGKKAVISSFNSSDDNFSMPVAVNAGISGSYKIEAAGIENVSDYTCITLEDKTLNKFIDLTKGQGYSFQLQTGDNENRFVLHFSKSGNCTKSIAATTALTSDFANQVTVLPTSEGNSISFNMTEATPATVSVTNVLGQDIIEGQSVVAETQTINIALPQDFSGIYIVKVKSSKGGIITKKYVRK